MADSPLKNIHPSIREVAVLQESTEMILSSMDVDTVLHQILLIVRNYFGAANCAVTAKAAESNYARPRHPKNNISLPTISDTAVVTLHHGQCSQRLGQLTMRLCEL